MAVAFSTSIKIGKREQPAYFPGYRANRFFPISPGYALPVWYF